MNTVVIDRLLNDGKVVLLLLFLVYFILYKLNDKN